MSVRGLGGGGGGGGLGRLAIRVATSASMEKVAVGIAGREELLAVVLLPGGGERRITGPGVSFRRACWTRFHVGKRENAARSAASLACWSSVSLRKASHAPRFVSSNSIFAWLSFPCSSRIALSKPAAFSA